MKGLVAPEATLPKKEGADMVWYAIYVVFLWITIKKLKKGKNAVLPMCIAIIALIAGVIAIPVASDAAVIAKLVILVPHIEIPKIDS